jgi:hypothetical protein
MTIAKSRTSSCTNCRARYDEEAYLLAETAGFAADPPLQLGGQYDSPTRKRPLRHTPTKAARSGKNPSTSSTASTAWHFEQRARELMQQKQEAQKALEKKR